MLHQVMAAQSRNGTIKSTLNGNIFWGGNTDGSTGPVSCHF
jgi:hypothetical protein